MKVLLTKDVEHVGYAGEVHKVSPGYGRNFLLPRGMAVLATDSALKQAQKWREQAAARREQLRKEYSALAERLNKVTIQFTAKAGDSGKLYGSVTTGDIAEKLNAQLGLEIDRRKIEANPIRQTGSHTVNVRLDKEFQAQIQVVVVAEGEEPAPAEATA